MIKCDMKTTVPQSMPSHTPKLQQKGKSLQRENFVRKKAIQQKLDVLLILSHETTDIAEELQIGTVAESACDEPLTYSRGRRQIRRAAQKGHVSRFTRAFP